MTDRWRNSYYAVAAFIALVSTALQWLGHRREIKNTASTLRDERQRLRATLSRRTKNLLQTNLLPVRRIQFNCSEEEKLEKELDAVFNKPEFVQSLRDYHAVLHDFELHTQRSRAFTRGRNACLIVSVVFFLAFCFPWVADLFDQPAEFGALSWLFLLITIESAAAYGILSILERRSRNRKESLLVEGMEQE